jgi:hypothetical protein
VGKISRHMMATACLVVAWTSPASADNGVPPPPNPAPAAQPAAEDLKTIAEWLGDPEKVKRLAETLRQIERLSKAADLQRAPADVAPLRAPATASESAARAPVASGSAPPGPATSLRVLGPATGLAVPRQVRPSRPPPGSFEARAGTSAGGVAPGGVSADFAPSVRDTYGAVPPPVSGTDAARSPEHSAYAVRSATGENAPVSATGVREARRPRSLLNSEAERIDDVDRVNRPILGVGWTPASYSVSPRGIGSGFHPEAEDPGFYTREEAQSVGRDALRMLQDVVTIAPAKGKVGMLMSTSTNDQLQRMHGSASDFSKKGFLVPTARIDAGFAAGALAGEFAVDYYKQHGDDEDEVLLQKAYAEVRLDHDRPERLVIKLGEITHHFGIYGGKEWVDAIWVQAPIVYSRLIPNNVNSFGVGFDFHLLPASWPVDSVLSGALLNADGENMTSFLGGDENFGGITRMAEEDRSLFGEFCTVARLANAIPLGRCSVLQLGASFAIGPNGLGDDGETTIFGAYGRLLWAHFVQDPCGGAPKPDGGLVAQAEWIRRDVFADAHDVFPRAELEDWGLFAMAVYDFPCIRLGWGDTRLSVGARYERADGSGGNFDDAGLPVSRSDDIGRNERESWSALVAWAPESGIPVLKNFAFAVEFRHDFVESHPDVDAILVSIQVR